MTTLSHHPPPFPGYLTSAVPSPSLQKNLHFQSGIPWMTSNEGARTVSTSHLGWSFMLSCNVQDETRSTIKGLTALHILTFESRVWKHSHREKGNLLTQRKTEGSEGSETAIHSKKMHDVSKLDVSDVFEDWEWDTRSNSSVKLIKTANIQKNFYVIVKKKKKKRKKSVWAHMPSPYKFHVGFMWFWKISIPFINGNASI